MLVPEARTRTCVLPGVNRLLLPLSYSGMALEDGLEPPYAHGFSVPLLPLSYSSKLDPTARIERAHGGSADRRLPTWQGRVVWHQEKELNPHLVGQSHVPYRLDHPGA